jgi:uncharacterized protein (DUF488 family)
LIDVRTLPGSKRHPQFNAENLEASLRSAKIHYRHMKGLGGLRKPKADSVNDGWRNASFRGYADYMQTEEFDQQLSELIESSREAPTAVMCAEAVPWRCHRSLLADALLHRKIKVKHITGKAPAADHQRTPFAKFTRHGVIYPGNMNLFHKNAGEKKSLKANKGSRAR